MTQFAQLFDRLVADGPLPAGDGALPLGAAWLPDQRHGVDLAAHGYVEQEYLVSGSADALTWDGTRRAVAGDSHAFTTRILVRRPADPARFSGAVQLEPHHPEDDRALSWAMIAPWIVAGGHAHVGVTQERAVLDDLIAWDPERYGALSIPVAGQRWDIVGLVAAAISSGRIAAFAELAVDRIVLSGWSMTGTFCRTFLGEGFHDRARLDGVPVVRGYVICISSGGAGRAGYATLDGGDGLPLGDRRRTIGGHGVPVVELLSEGESETHRAVLRPDSDDPQDPYRLFQVAGTGHIATGPPSLTTNRIQRRLRGAPSLPREINERPSDARMDLVARAVFDAVDRWITDGTAPPRANRFGFADAGTGAVRGRMEEAEPLSRDADGNVTGGLRTPWVEVPTATYLPHSTPRAGRCEPAPHAPYSDPALLADLVAHTVPFGAEELRRRYGDADAYLDRFARAARDLSAAGWLREADLPELLTGARESCHGW